MDIVTAVLTSGLIVAGWLWIGVRSYRRNIRIYERTPIGALFVAALAMSFWMVTLLYWLFGPTPERMLRRHFNYQALYREVTALDRPSAAKGNSATEREQDDPPPPSLLWTPPQ